MNGANTTAAKSEKVGLHNPEINLQKITAGGKKRFQSFISEKLIIILTHAVGTADSVFRFFELQLQSNPIFRIFIQTWQVNKTLQV